MVMIVYTPVYTEVHQDGRGQVVPQGPHHHHHLAGDVVSPPLHGVPPGSLQGEGDEAHYGVSNGEVEHQEVNIGAASEIEISWTYVWSYKNINFFTRNNS